MTTNRLPLFIVLICVLLFTATLVQAQPPTGITPIQQSTAVIISPSESVLPTTQPVIELSPPASITDDTISTALVNALFERLQNAGQTQLLITLFVIAVIVIPMSVMLYRSTPPGPVKNRLATEITAAAEAGLNGLKVAARLTPTDIDDDLIEWLSGKLQARLQQNAIMQAIDSSKSPPSSAGD